MDMEKHRFGNSRVKSIGQALELLNEAAGDSADELRDMMKKDYKKLARMMGDIKPQVRGAFKDIRSAAEETYYEAKDRVARGTREAAHRIDDSVHENPWTYLGTVAVLSGMLGFIFGRRNRD